MKPYKGEIHNWKKIEIPLDSGYEFGEGLGFKIFGIPRGHPTIVNWILTSEIVKMEPWDDLIRIETLNSCYYLIGGENV